MAEVVSLMDIDEDDNHQKENHSRKLSKGKNVVTTNDTKATPWVEKYRPQSLADVAAHRDIVDTIDRLTSENRLPHLLLYGPPGTGKTSTILAVARKLYGAHYHNMILELNASDERGIDVVRQQIQDFASTQSFSFGVAVQNLTLHKLVVVVISIWLLSSIAAENALGCLAKSSVKLILLDEADAMTKDAQFALRRVIEKYTKNTRFALICNHVNKIIPALQSRCTRFRFAPLDPIHVTERLKNVIEAERHVFCFLMSLFCAHSVDLLDVPDCGLAALVRLSNGDMRKALNILQSFCLAVRIVTEKEGRVEMLNILLSTHMASQQITEEAVYLCTGNPLPKDIEQISYWLLNESFAESFKRISEIKTRKGLALVDIVREVTMFVFKIKMPSDVRVQLINDLADIEYHLSFGCNDKLQLGSLIATFTRARSALVAAAK
ncbi:Replication factor C / DNA polymerase III gamma-tau subunit [Theobroma cacao]|uniref:Replication factor C / DNA polymerase III gamma-tau subunit n=1 Tax=Theobroma cacao TaxID=3641 RepID=A0A061FHG4_THECC|nr:Replication factor C / DNA polymerase III gamma-tau subunit [Theobroma cacao]